jgi:hypothetical protein
MDVSDAAAADRRNETRGQDDDSQASHKRATVTRVVANHVTDHAHDHPRPGNREAQQLEAAANNRSGLDPWKPPVRHRVYSAAAAGAKREQLDGTCHAVSHGVEFAEHESFS